MSANDLLERVEQGICPGPRGSALYDCTCCWDICDCGCRDECPVWRGLSASLEKG